MDLAKLKQASAQRVERDVSQHRHESVLNGQAQIAQSVLTSTTALIRYLEGHTSKTEVVNQLKEIGTPDALKVIPEIKALHATLKTHKNVDLSELTGVMRSILDEAKAIPKAHPDAPEPRFIDYTGQFAALGDAIKAISQVVREQKLVAEAPVVNVPAANVQVDAPDLDPLRDSITDVVTAVKAIVIPEYRPTDTAGIEKLLTRANKLLGDILDKPVGGGGGGGGRVSPYQDAQAVPAFVTLNPDGSVPIGGQIVPTSFDYIGYASGSNTDVYTYKENGSTVATVTVTYTSSTKAVLQSVARS